MDVYSPEKRSRIMAKIKGKNTRPEIIIRSLLHGMGYRFRLHRRDLPGNPDIVLPKYNKVVFVHGCFWHGHKGCPRSKLPSTHTDFWRKKISKNITRDEINQEKLRSMGWDVLLVWQCEIKKRNIDELQLKLKRYMSGFTKDGIR